MKTSVWLLEQKQELSDFCEKTGLSQQQVINLALENEYNRLSSVGKLIEVNVPTEMTKKLIKGVGEFYNSVQEGINKAIEIYLKN